MDPQTERASTRVGTTLKQKWRIDKLIGVGGMAAVYAATHRNGKRVAIKMLHPEISLDPQIRQRFLREGYVANTVGQRGAVTVDDDDVSEDGSAFLVMELLQGETLEARAQRKGKKLPEDEVLSLCDQVLDTLAAAHAQNIVHRDLKPENLFLTRDGVVKVLDFGIARIRQASGQSQSSATQTGALMGTPAFMPPEQARSRWDEVDARSDLWALGATMFTLLTGRYVHEADTVTEALVLAVTSHARSVGALEPSLHPAVVRVVDTALAYDKAERFQDARAMQDALRAAYHALASGASANAHRLSIPDDSATGLEPPEPPTIVGSKPEGTTEPGVSNTVGGRSAIEPKTLPLGVDRPNRPRGVLLVAAAAALIGFVVVLGFLRSSNGPSTAASEAPPPLAAPSVPSVADAPVKAPEPLPPGAPHAVRPEELPRDDTSTPPVGDATKKKVATQAPKQPDALEKAISQSAAPKTATASPEPSKPAPPPPKKPAPAADPFSARF